MATVNGLTKERMLAIEAASVTDGDVVGDNLVLTRHDGTTIVAGNVRGPQGTAGTNGINMTAGALWGNGNLYVVNNTVGYNGRLYTCIQANVNKCPPFYNDYWTPVTGGSPETWPLVDSMFMSEDLDAHDLFWRSGTVTSSLTSTAGEFESGFQAMKLIMGDNSNQHIYEKGEVLVRGDEIITVSIRAKVTAAVAVYPTVAINLHQAPKDGSPQPFGSDASSVGGSPLYGRLGTSWSTFTFTVQAQPGKPRARMSVNFSTTTNGATIVVDRIEVSKIQTKLDLKADKTSIDRLRDTSLRQRVFSGGGIRFVSATGVRWNQRFILMGAGRNQAFASNGYFDIEMPPNGTVIPRYGLSGGTPGSVTVSGGVIPMSSWDALWYELPGVPGAFNAANFRIVNHLSDYVIPNNWIFVCIKNADSYAAMYTWGDGRDQDGWRGITPASGWASSPTATQKSAAVCKNGNIVRLRGVITGTLNVSTSVHVLTIPAAYRPDNASNFCAALTTGGHIGWANVTDTGGLWVHFKTPYTSGTTTLELSAISYSLN